MHTHTDIIVHRGETTNVMRTVGFEGPWRCEGAGYQLIHVSKHREHVGGFDWMHQQEAWMEKVPLGMCGT